MSEEYLHCPKCGFLLGMEGGQLIGGYRLHCLDCGWHGDTYDNEREAYYGGTNDSKSVDFSNNI